MLSQNDIIYFILTDRFYDGDPNNNFDVNKSNPNGFHGGDFEGIKKKIPYLKNLGITALWITPVYINCSLRQYDSWGYHGYWALDFEKVDPHLYTPKPGYPEGSALYLKDLADELHANGIKLILDMVVNHTGYGHPALADPSENIPNPTPIRRDWFHNPGSNNLEEMFLAGLPDLNQDNLAVADYFVNVTLDWIEKAGIDCIRMDTAKHVDHMFWYLFKTYVKGKYPDISLLGEVLVNDIDELSHFQQHFAFDSLFDFPLQDAMKRVFIRDESMTILAAKGVCSGETPGILDRDNVYTNHNRLVTLLDNHDLPMRYMSEAVGNCSGNRSFAMHLLKLSIAFMMTTRGIPQIYYGTEVAMEGFCDPDNRRDMPWYMFGDGLEPLMDYEAERDCFLYLKNLIRIRKENEALCYGSLVTLFVDQFVYVYLREYRGDVVITAINNGHTAMQEWLFIHPGTNANVPARVRELLEGRTMMDEAGCSMPISISNGSFGIKLEGKTAAVYTL